MASSVAVLVAMFLIYSTMAISVRQRRQEIGVLRALGMNRRQVIGLFTLEGTLLGCVGSVLGIFAGLLLSNAVRGGLVIAALAAGYCPARVASRHVLANALAYE